MEEDNRLWEKLEEIERGDDMPYITSVERIGIKKGALENSREMVLEALEVRFGEIPQEITELINSLDDVNKLKILHRQAIKCASLDEFKRLLDKK